jgi:hypothetical protein
MLEFAASWDLVDSIDPVQWSIRLLVPPGSLLEAHPRFLPVRAALDTARFTWTWSHPDPRVDALQRDVAALVEAAAVAGEDPRATFAAVAHAAARAAGAAHGSRPRAAGLKGRTPRLTEPWFC